MIRETAVRPLRCDFLRFRRALCDASDRQGKRPEKALKRPDLPVERQGRGMVIGAKRHVAGAAVCLIDGL